MTSFRAQLAQTLPKAVSAVFGDPGLIAGAGSVSERNILDAVPVVGNGRPLLGRTLRAAWANPDAGEAEAALKALAAQPGRVNP
jgi:hypothetical protein